ncbi:MAG: alpha/beta hydrolase [SAR92 clade bacterium]|uniref:Alpha/beta hydrolase n=1 Tax=SAR92 clade bacterium TaxID=2315479 RepID=A0A520MIX3_9GAMM|nr:MAG: alpha/beta hydrolase [SAR92 clade bacterium]
MRNIIIASILGSFISLVEADSSHSYIQRYPLITVIANDIEISYREIGVEDNPKVLLIMGLGASHLVHGDNLVRGIEQAGYQVLIFDNRDTGGSTRFDDWGQPTIWWQLLKDKLGFRVDAPYSLDDMTEDTVGLLDAVGYEHAHVMGFSMGGMIAQQLAAKYPERVLTLTSVMSTTFAKHLPPPTGAAETALTNLASGEASESRIEAIRKRGFYPESMPRQMMAIFKTGDRSNEVKTINVNTLVIHGEDDGLVPPAHGEHTAELIRGAELVIFPGMGHNIPKDVLPKMLGYMIEHMKTVDYGKDTLNTALD